MQGEISPDDPSGWGKPIYFDMQLHIDSIIQMIRADELEFAIKMLDQIPAWYQEPENRPKELNEIKSLLYRQAYDVFLYSQDPEEAACKKSFGLEQADNGYMYPRDEIITGIVQDMNEKGKEPWFYDLGCSHGNLPLLLMKRRLKFNYRGRAMNSKIEKKVKRWTAAHWRDLPSPGQHSILWCTEVLEHCWREEDIVHAAHKAQVPFDSIILSVPYGCHFGGLPNWNERPLGHVRGYSKKRFAEFARDNFPGYEWKLFIAPSMVIIGKRL